jgi:glycosyltransferase involved in cell wall biosynthesis
MQVYHQIGGGVSTYVNTLNRALAEIDRNNQIFNFVAVSNKELTGYRDEVSDGIYYRKVGIDFTIHLDDNILLDCLNPSVQESFSEYLDEVNPDIVSFQYLTRLGGAVVGLAKDKGFPTILTLHDYWTICPRLFLLKKDLTLCNGPNQGTNCVTCVGSGKINQAGMYMLRYQFFRNLLMNQVDKVIAVSNSIKERMVQEGIDRSKIITVYPSVYENDVHPTSGSESNCTSITIGYIGHISPHKGIHVIFKSLVDCRNEMIRFHYYGNKEQLYESTISELSANLRNVSYMGTYFTSDLPRIFSEIDVLVVPSIVPETGPLVVQEALRHRVPVIGSDLGGIPEYVTDRWGALFQAGNVEQLTDILNRLTTDQIKAWKSNIPKLPSPRCFAEQIMQVYETVVSEAGTKRQMRVDSRHRYLLKPEARGFLRQQFIPSQVRQIADEFSRRGFLTVSIFGTGELAQKVSRFLRHQGFEIAAFLDNNAQKWGARIGEVIVLNPAEWNSVSSSVILVISDWEHEIMRQLEQMKLTIPVVGLYSYHVEQKD